MRRKCSVAFPEKREVKRKYDGYKTKKRRQKMLAPKLGKNRRKSGSPRTRTLIIRFFLLVMRFILISLCVYGAVAKTPSERISELDFQNQVLNEITRNYDPNERPPPEENVDYSSVVVHANMVIIRARWHNNIADMELILREEWIDRRLKFLPKISYVTLSGKNQIWKPDTFFATAEQTHKSMDKQFLRVEPEGWVMYSQRYTLKAQCRPSSSAYPLINQKLCTLKIGSYAFTFEDIVYVWRKDSPVTFNEEEGAFQEFTIADLDPESCEANVTTGKYSCIKVDIKFQGPIHEPVVYFYLPSVLLLFLSWLHFWIHGSWTVPRSFSAIVPFFLFVLALFFIPHPQVTQITAYEIWLIFCVVLSFLSFFEYIICIYAGVKRSHTPQVHSDFEKPLLSDKEDGKSQDGRPSDAVPATTKLDWTCRALFPIIFIIFVAIYLVLFLFI